MSLAVSNVNYFSHSPKKDMEKFSDKDYDIDLKHHNKSELLGIGGTIPA
jgi:hypothetical protein